MTAFFSLLLTSFFTTRFNAPARVYRTLPVNDKISVRGIPLSASEWLIKEGCVEFDASGYL